MAAAPRYENRSGSITVPPPDNTTRSGSIVFNPWDVYPCWGGCSGSITVSSSDPTPDYPDIPAAAFPAASLHVLFEEETQTYDPGVDIDYSSLPNGLDTVFTADISHLIDDRGIEIVSLSDPERVWVDYEAAVPETRLIINQPRFLDIAQPELGISPLLFDVFSNALPSNAIPSNILARDKFLHFVPLNNGAIPSNAIPSNAIPSNLRISAAIPANAIPSNYHGAIPSNSWGLVHAIPSNMTRADLLALGADADKLPAAIPSNLTVERLRSYGIPSNAIPSNAIPSNAIPSNAIPSNAIPSNLVVLDLMQSLIDLPAFGIEVGLRPQSMIQSQLEFDLGVANPALAGRVKAMGCDGSCSSSGRIVADAQAVDAEYDLTSLGSSLIEVGGLLEVSRPGNDRVQLAYNWGFGTIQLPYRTGREQGPDVGVETVTIGPYIGVEMIEIGNTVACREDFTNVSTWLGHKYYGGFAVQYILPEGQSYQSDTYQLTIGSEDVVDCVFDVENPKVLHCTSDDITPNRWLDFELRSQPSNCEVWGGSYYVCPVGETYYGANVWWSGGCCTTTCWCTLPGDSQPGCWNSCPGCP
jgi:hypothetical protein